MLEFRKVDLIRRKVQGTFLCLKLKKPLICERHPPPVFIRAKIRTKKSFGTVAVEDMIGNRFGKFNSRKGCRHILPSKR